MDISWKEFKSAVDPTGVLGLLLSSSFLFASIVALFSHCDSTAAPPSPASATVISGRSVGTCEELASLLRRCRRSEKRLAFGDRVDECSLAREVDDAADAWDELLPLPRKKRLVRDSRGPSANARGSDDSVEEKVGGEIISCVWVSDLMNVKTGLSNPSSS